MSQQAKESRNPAPSPAGFEEFWCASLRELLCVDPTPRLLDEEVALGKAQLAAVNSFGATEVRVFLAEASGEKGPEPRPLLITSHGYGGEMEPERVRRLAQFGFNVVGLDVRGFGQSRASVPRVSPYGYLLTGYESKETSILRGAILDYIQAYRAGLAYFGDPGGVTFQGFSFAGGLSLMATAVLCLGSGESGAPCAPHLLASGVPTFGYLEKRLELCQAGSGRELYRFLQERISDMDAIKSMFEYFDTCHFAPHLKTSDDGLRRIICGVGLYDPIVPPETVYAIVNAMPQPPELLVMPCSHTDRPEEAEWVRFEGAWIRAARKVGRA